MRLNRATWNSIVDNEGDPLRWVYVYGERVIILRRIGHYGFFSNPSSLTAEPYVSVHPFYMVRARREG